MAMITETVLIKLPTIPLPYPFYTCGKGVKIHTHTHTDTLFVNLQGLTSKN